MADKVIGGGQSQRTAYCGKCQKTTNQTRSEDIYPNRTEWHEWCWECHMTTNRGVDRRPVSSQERDG